MKLLVFSDIHGNIYALDNFLKQIESFNYDRIIFLGDIFGYYYNQSEVIARLKEIPNLIWLKGNHDIYAIDIYCGRKKAKEYTENFGSSYDNLKARVRNEDIMRIDAMSCYKVLNDGERHIGLFHGTPCNPMEGRLYPKDMVTNPEFYTDYDIVILWHTHWRMCRFVYQTLVVNPGSLGQPRDGKGFSFAIIDTILKSVEFMEIVIDKSCLFKDIERNDPYLGKLKDVLERKL